MLPLLSSQSYCNGSDSIDRRLDEFSTNRTASWIKIDSQSIERKLPLDTTPQRCDFNEVTRYVKKHTIEEIKTKMTFVNNQEISDLIEICSTPEDILTKKKSFFLDKKFPFILLQALDQNTITTDVFTTLQSLHTSIHEHLEIDAKSLPQLHLLFNKDEKPNTYAWNALADTIKRSNTTASKLQLNTQIIIEKLQSIMAAKLPIECCFWMFKILEPITNKSLYKHITNTGSIIFSKYDNRRMLVSLTLYQNFLNCAFAENACKIIPVIGLSSSEDLRDNGYKFHRDFVIPFPTNPLPKEAHNLETKLTIDFQYHDFYHALRMSMMTHKEITVYLAAGDALANLRNRYQINIQSLVDLSKEKLKYMPAFKNKLSLMSASIKKEAQEQLYREFYAITQVLTLLKRMRKAIGQFKHSMYDLDVIYFTQIDKNLKSKDGSKYSIYLLNFLITLSIKNKFSPPVLEGVALKSAGKSVAKAASAHFDMLSACQTFLESLQYKREDLSIAGETKSANVKVLGNNYKNVICFLNSALTHLQEENLKS